MRGEFELIARYFAPLAATEGAFGLRDDAAVLQPPEGEDLVLTTDTISAGVHFLPDDPADTVARKLLRVNLSDLAAMGARPLGYLLAAGLAEDVEEAWIAAFAQGLAEDQEIYGIGLLGGDTTVLAGPTTLSLTAVGAAPRGRVLQRGGAAAGDEVFVSGTVGDAALGLLVLTGKIVVERPEDEAWLTERYRLPRPRVTLGRSLLERALASAAIDISDGLVADLGHICEASGLGAEMRAPSLPLSTAGQRLIEGDPDLFVTALTGGDDYELAFTVPPERAHELAALASALDLPLTRVGRMVSGDGVRVLGADGRPVTLASAGWTHL